MAAKRKPKGITENIHPAVIEAAGLDCDRPEERAWIAERYNASLHPLPVYFAETFDQWNRATEEERERQIRLEESDPIGGRFTLLGASMGDGILAFRERFAKACAAAVTVGDREFFRVFNEVYSGLGKGEFQPPYRAVVLRAYEFLTTLGDTQEWDESSRQWVKKRLIAGEFPTIAEIRDYIERAGIFLGLKNSDPYGAILRVLNKNGLRYADDDGHGGDRRSALWEG